MKLSIPLVVLASATSAMAGCYTSGKPYLNDCNKDSFKGAVDDLCDKAVLSGWFNAPRTRKTACANARCNGIKVNLEVEWRGPSGGATLAVSDCKWRLKNEIDGCDKGGESVVADWFFK